MTYCIVYPQHKPRRFYEEAAQEYEKRLSRFCKIQRGASFNRLGVRDILILITPDGKRLSSEDVANRLLEIQLSGSFNRVVFAIEQNLNLQVDESWALTSVSLPADLQCVLLLEQIYRGYKIIRNEPYHK